jgi:hypothetical protein
MSTTHAISAGAAALAAAALAGCGVDCAGIYLPPVLALSLDLGALGDGGVVVAITSSQPYYDCTVQGERAAGVLIAPVSAVGCRDARVHADTLAIHTRVPNETEALQLRVTLDGKVVLDTALAPTWKEHRSDDGCQDPSTAALSVAVPPSP